MQIKFRKIIAGTLVVLSASFMAVNGCKKDEIIQPLDKPICIQEGPYFSRLVIETYPGPPGGDSIRCPKFIFWNRPFHIGDTLAINVSSRFDFSGAPVIGGKPVFVTATSKLGDSETYWLKGASWPCQTIADDTEHYSAIIFYNTTPLGYPVYPFPNNGHLEIRTTGDTLVASYVSYCTGNIVRDTVALLPK